MLDESGEPPIRRSHFEDTTVSATTAAVREAGLPEAVDPSTSQRVPRPSRFQVAPVHPLRGRVRETDSQPATGDNVVLPEEGFQDTG